MSDLGSLALVPALDHPELVAAPVLAALTALATADPADAAAVLVAAIDPELADTAAFCAAYEVSPEVSGNCVLFTGPRGPDTRTAAAVVLATTRVDVNGIGRRELDVRRASFAAREDAVAASGMEYGGITPIGLPPDWPVLLDPAVAALPMVVVGSGIRGSKFALPGSVLTVLPGVRVVAGLGRVPTP